jgi:hypothetical protein
MHKDHLNGSHGTPKATNDQSCRQPENTSRLVSVLNQFPLYADPESAEIPTPPDEEAEQLKLFKVFIKRNLPHQQPAPDLLVRIHQRIDALKK